MIDEIKINVKGGNGGDGVVHFRHEKFRPKGGPDGGDGGKGGDVYLKVVRDVTVLQNYKRKRKFEAKNGKDGKKANKTGKDGESITLDVPIGSFVTNLDTKETYDLTEEGQIVMVCAGGAGGLGNVHFKSSHNTTPKISTKGVVGQEYNLHIELKMIADIGFIGFPNAGKTTLLNALTEAKGKVGSYKFTTLSPGLGVYHQYVLADIPGLIEDASKGKGLGHKFLRHVSRAKMLVHLIALDEYWKDPNNAYKTIRKELKDYSNNLTEKPEIIFLTKSDLVSDEEIKNALTKLSPRQKKIFVINKDDGASLKKAMDGTIKALKEHF